MVTLVQSIEGGGIGTHFQNVYLFLCEQIIVYPTINGKELTRLFSGAPVEWFHIRSSALPLLLVSWTLSESSQIRLTKGLVHFVDFMHIHRPCYHDYFSCGLTK